MAAKNINLLPKEFTVSKGVTDASVKFKKALWSAIGFYAVLLAVCGALYYYFQTTLTNLESDQSRLKTNIQSLQETETQLILTKDRIAKVKTVLDTRQNEDIFGKHKIVIDSFGPSMSLEDSDITIGSSLLTLKSTNSRDLVNFMTSLLARGESLSLVMDSLSFNPFTGYQVGLEIF